MKQSTCAAVLFLYIHICIQAASCQGTPPETYKKTAFQAADATLLRSHYHPPKQPVDYVNPNIGGISHLLASIPPEVQVPHGMIRATPYVSPSITDVYLAQAIEGFSATGSVWTTSTGIRALGLSENASRFDHDKEIVTPFYASYILDDFAIRVEYAPTQHCMYFRFSFTRNSPAQILLRAKQAATYQFLGPAAVSGTEVLAGDRAPRTISTYIYAEFSKPPKKHGSFRGETLLSGSEVSGKDVGMVLEYGSNAPKVEVRMGVSYISAEQAKRNLRREIPDWDIEKVKENARTEWNAELSRILVKGGTESQRTVFYTALYRSHQYMADITEDGKYFNPFDQKVHSSENHDFYIEDNLWDTYRTRHPLQLITEPERHQDMLRSFIRMYQASGWMPQFPFMDGDRAYMIGNHVSSIFADSYFKGQRDFDVETAYEGIRKNALEATLMPYRRGDLTSLDRVYLDKGYFIALKPGEVESVKEVDADMRRQAVSVTLEDAYDAWNIAALARALEKPSDAAYFSKRAQNFRNVFDPATGYMAPRDADGHFIAGFNPKWGGGQAGRDYFTECNGLVYSFQVQQDIPALIELMGGREQFLKRLDSLFTEAYDGRMKFEFLAQFPDSTALIGQYPQGNEPSFHIPYLYNYAREPWKTQKKVRDIMSTWYSAQPLGLPGDDDNGSISSWYVFSAMGFYPTSPGKPVYDIGSPLFAETDIDVGEGKHFRIVAHNVSAVNKYIQSASLNGKPLNTPRFAHSALSQGGVLVLRMGPEPNREWGGQQ